MGVNDETNKDIHLEGDQRPQPHAPWMSQQKKGRGMKKKAAKKAKRQDGCAQNREDDAVVNGDGDGLRRETAARAPQARRAPARSFVPSAAREVLLKRRNFLRRGGCGSDMVDRLRRMQCPFMWDLEPLADCSVELYDLLESTPICPTPWHVAVQNIHFAFEFARYRKLWKSRELLEEVYAVLAALDQALGKKHRDKDMHRDELLLKYRAGLKHVLDCSWLLVRDDRDAAVGAALPDGTLPEELTPFDELNNQQKASVWAMRAIMAPQGKHCL